MQAAFNSKRQFKHVCDLQICFGVFYSVLWSLREVKQGHSQPQGQVQYVQ